MRVITPIATGLLSLLAACEAAHDDPARHSVTDDETTPSLADELANTTYTGLRDRPVKLTEGTWEGAAFVPGSATAPRAGLLRDFDLTGDLDGKPGDEVVAALWTSEGGSGTFDFVAILSRDATGVLRNIATSPLGDRVRIRAAKIESRRLIMDMVQAGPDDAACCPGQKIRRVFELEGGELRETETIDQGRLSVADLADVEWFLRATDLDTGLPAELEATLIFDGTQVGGSAGCNRYSGSVAEGPLPGELSLAGPLAVTMMACQEPANRLEALYLAALQATRGYSFLGGRLVLQWGDEKNSGRLLFEGRSLPE